VAQQPVQDRASLVQRLLRVAALALVCTLGQQSTFDSVMYCIRSTTRKLDLG
jgi:hypothetical protein